MAELGSSRELLLQPFPIEVTTLNYTYVTII
jgi:hypothetical protein